MTVLEYLQSLDLETRVAVVGCADNALRGIRNLDEQTAAADSFGLWACPDYLAQQLGLAFNCNYPASADAKRCTRCAAAFTGIPWYFININHPAMRLFYDGWMQSRGRASLPGDVDRAEFELSLLSNKALGFVADKYKREGRL